MTTKKTATVAAVAVTLVAVMLAYSAMVLPASAQTAATSSTSASTSNSNSNTTVAGGQWGGPQGLGGHPGPFQVGLQGGFPGVFQGGRGPGGQWGAQQQANLTVGQTITVTSSQGRYSVVGDANATGTASGTVTFTVTGKLAAGYTLSITSGSVAVNGTTYTISSGSAQMDLAATTLTGQGATTPAGQFIIQAQAHGSFAGSSATMSLDLGAGSTEYLVSLSGTVEG
jgi:hypothetical protein